ncbi:unnamed protein product [Rhodiola kirilowii]
MGFDQEATPPILQPLVITSNPNTPHLSSNLKTFANVFIAIVGAGVLGLPYAFKRTGWVTSILIIVPVAALTYHCMMLLVSTRRKLEQEKAEKITSFGDLGFRRLRPVRPRRCRFHDRVFPSRVLPSASATLSSSATP